MLTCDVPNGQYTLGPWQRQSWASSPLPFAAWWSRSSLSTTRNARSGLAFRVSSPGDADASSAPRLPSSHFPSSNGMHGLAWLRRVALLTLILALGAVLSCSVPLKRMVAAALAEGQGTD